MTGGFYTSIPLDGLIRSVYYYSVRTVPDGHELGHGSTVGEVDEKATHDWMRTSEWSGLEILSSKGGPDDLTGRVDFVARFSDKRGDQEHSESSIFKKKNGRWFYVDGKPGGSGQETIRREEPKVGRNDPCPCDSGKKFKKCHGRPGAKA